MTTQHQSLSGTENLRPLGTYPLHGGCPCSHVRYTLSSAPIIVNACHCTYCQRETGAAFAFNAIYEPDRVVPTLATGETGADAEAKLLTKGVPSLSSGAAGQLLVRCPECYGIVWSHYARAGGLKMVRAGTVDGVLDEQGRYVACGGLKPDAHIFTGNGHQWMNLEGFKVYEASGVKKEYYSEEGLGRLEEFTGVKMG